MPKAQRSVQIGRPLAEVFAFFADSENDPQWRPLVKEIKRTGPLGAGATYRQRIAGPAGRAIPSDFTITRYEPESRLAFQVTAGPVRPRGEYRFRAVAGGTDVTFEIDAELSGWKKYVLSGPVQKSMDSEVAALDRAKAILESRA